MRGPGQTHDSAAADSPYYRSLQCRFQLHSGLWDGDVSRGGLCEGDQRRMNKSFPQNSRPAKRAELSRGRKAWLTLGTVAAYAAVSVTKSHPAWAQAANPNAVSGKTK